MPIIKTIFNEDGTCTNIRQAWTADDLIAHIADIRWQQETLDITVGGAVFSTQRHEMTHWVARRDHAIKYMAGDEVVVASLQATNGMYPYKPYAAKYGRFLTPQQAFRAYECIEWRVNACFAIEIGLQQAIAQGANLDAIYAAAQGAETWPQIAFEWEA